MRLTTAFSLVVCFFTALLLFGAGEAAEPSGVPDSDENPLFAKFETSEGPFVIEINPSWSPKGAERFLELVRANYFDGQRVFRVIPDFLVQFGYNPDPAVTRKYGAQLIRDDPFKVSNYKGYVAFAGSRKDSRSTHVFINLHDNFFIDHRDVWATPFARVVTGMDVVERFYAGYQRAEKRGGPTPQQGRIAQEGNAYLEKEFPLLTEIERVRLVRMPAPPHRARQQRVESRAGIPAVTLKPFPAHWKDPPASLDAANLADEVDFPHGYGRGSREAAKWIRLNERMDIIAEAEREQEVRKQALLNGGGGGGGTANVAVANIRGGVRAGSSGNRDEDHKDMESVVEKALKANEEVAKAVAVKIGDEVHAAEEEIEHDSPVMVVLAIVGAAALLWVVASHCCKGNRDEWKAKR